MRLLKAFCLVGTLGALSVGWGPAAKGQVQSNQPQQRDGTQASVNSQSRFYGGISQIPWFGNATIRQQLQLNDDQFNKLNQGYTQSWSRYNQGINSLDKDLAEAQRMQRQQELNRGFYTDYSRSLDDVFSEKSARQRYNQMEWQYRGYGAFNDPMLQQRLKLNDDQRQAFNKYDREWNQQLNTWQREFGDDRTGTAKGFRDARKELQDRINSTLNDEQRTVWTDVIGKPYEFPVDVYFQNSGATGLNPVVK